MNQPERVVILGGGESGTGAALLAKSRKYDVFLSDTGQLKAQFREELSANQISFEEGQHSADKILNADLVIKSPGIPDSAPLITQLLQNGIPVIGEIEFGARFSQAKFIGITGSNGKTTTTLLTYHLLKSAGLSVGLAGNVGHSLARQVLEGDKDFYVVELSSFQLDNMFDFKAHIAVLLNITPDHLDRYQYNFNNYINSKFRIAQNQTSDDFFIYFNESSPIEEGFATHAISAHKLPISLIKTLSAGGFLDSEGILHVESAEVHFEFPLEQLPIQGPHNAINSLAAILAAKTVGISDEAIKEALITFKNASHRLEPAGEVNGVKYVNDSKATNVDSVFYALGSFNQPIVLILGGVDKGNDYSQIDELVAKNVKAIVAMGTDNAPVISHFTGKVTVLADTNSLTEAFRTASGLASPGDVVLLSPACASFDLFKNYEDRGEQFKKAVQLLATNNQPS